MEDNKKLRRLIFFCLAGGVGKESNFFSTVDDFFDSIQ